MAVGAKPEVVSGTAVPDACRTPTRAPLEELLHARTSSAHSLVADDQPPHGDIGATSWRCRGVVLVVGIRRDDHVRAELQCRVEAGLERNREALALWKRTTWSTPHSRATSAVPSVEPSSTTSHSTAKPRTDRGRSARVLGSSPPRSGTGSDDELHPLGGSVVNVGGVVNAVTPPRRGAGRNTCVTAVGEGVVGSARRFSVRQGRDCRARVRLRPLGRRSAAPRAATFPFFVVRGSGTWEVVAFAVGLVVVPPVLSPGARGARQDRLGSRRPGRPRRPRRRARRPRHAPGGQAPRGRDRA